MMRILLVFIVFQCMSFLCYGFHYNFDYHISGDQTIAPLQVFDDGYHTYFHFVSGVPVPAVFSVNANGMFLLPLVSSPGHRFWLGDCCYDRLVLILGDRKVLVVRHRLKDDHAVVYRPFVVGASTYHDHVAESVHLLSVSAPVQTADPGAERSLLSIWPVHRSLGTLRAVLLSWSARAHYQLLWRLDRDFPIVADAVFQGDFVTAAHALLTTLLHQGLFLRFHLYEKNHVFVVDHAPYGAHMPALH